MKTEAREVRAALANPREVCQALGLMPSRRDFMLQRGGVTVRCPRHGGMSLSVTLGSEGTIRVKCHGSCDLAGDVFTLIAAIEGLDLAREFVPVLRRGAEIAGLWAIVDELDKKTTKRENKPRIKPKPVEEEGPPIDAARYHEIASALLQGLDWSPSEARTRPFDPECKAYLETRGIFAHAQAWGVRGLPSDRETQALIASILVGAFGDDAIDAGLVRVLRDGSHGIAWNEHVLVIPWRDRDGTIVCLQRRRITERPDDPKVRGPKYVFPRGIAPRVPFGAHLFQARPSAKVVFVEGALDAIARDKLAWMRDEERAILGIPSAAAIDASWSEYAARRDVVIALDADRAGARAGKAIADLVTGAAESVSHEVPFFGKDWGAELQEIIGSQA